ncbi:MAG TPA: OmpW family protein [Pseudolabrys sp.]|nr:OmpW family protein [Pseudolabrys sp.]
MKRTMTIASLLLATTMLSVLALPANAADVAVPAPAYKAPPAIDAWNPWMIRLRALGVVTRNSGHVDQIPGSDLNVSDSIVPELDISYFFTPNIAAELILGVTRHHVTGAGSIAGVDVGKAWLLPPTLTLQYHFTNFGAFKPYIGAGVNYTMFFSQEAAGGAVTALDLKNSFAPALQIGFDYMIDRHWGVNVDVKKLWLQPSFNATVGGAPVTGKANLDPWLIGAGVTYKF